jgi:hypothetical protein
MYKKEHRSGLFPGQSEQDEVAEARNVIEQSRNENSAIVQ